MDEASSMTLLAEETYGTFDVSLAMGLFVRDTHLEYLDLMKSLKERVKMKLGTNEGCALWHLNAIG